MSLITLYARKTPALDQPRRFNVLISKDRESRDVVCIFQWWMKSKPRAGQKKVTINCWPWALQWIA